MTSARIKSGSEVGVGDRESDGEAASATDSDAEGVDDGSRGFFCLVDSESLPRGLTDFVAAFFALFVDFDEGAFGRGGEKSGRLRLETVGAIVVQVFS